MEHKCGVCEQDKDPEELRVVESYVLCAACLGLLIGLLQAVCS